MPAFTRQRVGYVREAIAGRQGYHHGIWRYKAETALFLLLFVSFILLLGLCMRKKILVVDDNKHLLGLLRLNLKGQGFSIATAANGIDAIQKAVSLAPDLILLDLMLPGLDGFAVCETLRKHPVTASTPIIIMTGLSGQFTRFAGFESGGSDFITKPVTPKALLSKIKELLEPPQTPADVAA